jgi:hypothetical protein
MKIKEPKELKIITSVAMHKVDDYAYEIRVIKTQGDKVISNELPEGYKPNIRAIAEELFKKAVVHFIFKQGK